MSSPFVLQLKNRECLVIGGGTIAERKINHLLTEGAAVTVISPTLTEGLRQRVGDFTFKKAAVAEADVGHEGCSRLDVHWGDFFLVVVATNFFPLNQELASNLSRFVSLINVVDNQELSSFFFPSVVDRGLLKIAVTTSGASPILARKIREHLANMIGPEYREYVEYLAEMRNEIQEKEADPKRRKEMLEVITNFPYTLNHVERSDKD